jgi:hypothetical protein
LLATIIRVEDFSRLGRLFLQILFYFNNFNKEGLGGGELYILGTK